MIGWAQMRPRSPRAAGQAVFAMSVVACSVTAVSAALPQAGNVDPIGLAFMYPLLALVVFGAWSLRRVASADSIWWTLAPPLAIMLVVGLDLATNDASIAAQIFLLFPALWAASQLPRRGAVAVATASALADVVVVFSLQPVRLAVVNSSYVSAALLTASVLLVTAGERNDRLLHRLREQASVDPLTGLATRRVFEAAADAAIASRHQDAGTALILMDLDRFKHINDAHGHPSGDQALVQLAEVLRQHCRSQDLISRLGGDEIAILMAGTTFETAKQRAEVLRRTVSESLFRLAETGSELRLSVSVGVAHAPSHAQELRTLYAAADRALYEAKRAGRDRVVFSAVPVDAAGLVPLQHAGDERAAS